MSWDCACGSCHRDVKYRDFHSRAVINIANKFLERHPEFRKKTVEKEGSS